ncbi:bifunctional 5,10-methylenetetrahydrofolate dehydrogenase/5,10-methenyltetrahydrofolate cyclohydrolase [Candidatus Saccharibacteria bacterium]|nr:bifunctional 5,10-methylenetetrahydrofolate dehydrogenase/5,10-methenyltetrahydrofolate cyclohydrolase [Candidatus Saccharibacteria bacterium]MBI3338454.1 bifunctional 5,10-methylenetetrahydrofolate dehydrogenase/5,10-methenyltetrahydrofolate cyclohydrolase [Candidatus Saccharibacteria bacterium]
MKLLNGKELAEFIKERQARQVRGLIQAHDTVPKLAIVQCKDDPVINTYVKLKKQYGADLGAEADIHFVNQKEVPDLLKKLNADELVHGIIVQLPLADTGQTDEIVNMVAPEKDVDALGEKAKYDPATPMAIMWLLSGYNVDLNGKHVLLVGRGKLVGAPLEKILKKSGIDVEVVERGIADLATHTKEADVIITATGSPAILYSKMIKQGAVVVDAGVASEEGRTVGDLADDVYDRDDLTITPQKGGVGPLTVCALFENVIRATQQHIL